MRKMLDTIVIAGAYLLLKFGFIIVALIIGIGLWGVFDGLRDLITLIFSK